jgi:uncharacterized damage-inducible protein DinB
MILRPSTSEHAPYFSLYINLVPEGDFFEELEASSKLLCTLFEQISPEKAEFRYAEGKWTPKEMLMHIIDTERIFVYRALTIARNDKTTLPGFDENAYAAEIDVTSRTVSDLIAEFNAVRQATVLFFKYLPLEKTSIVGNANQHPTSARALAYMIIGHVLHHSNILKERYL